MHVDQKQIFKNPRFLFFQKAELHVRMKDIARYLIISDLKMQSDYSLPLEETLFFKRRIPGVKRELFSET